MNKAQAIQAINKIFSQYSSNPNIPSGKGKIYELYCLGLLMEELNNDGFTLIYNGPNPAVFKAGPGKIHVTDPHFNMEYNGQVCGQIFLNIEFQTLGSQKTKSTDRSCRHELDIIIVENGVVGRPTHKQLLMGVECKSTANFKKGILKETLGVRREMTLLGRIRNSRLTSICNSRKISINCNPSSEYRLCFVDPAGAHYSASAKHFSIVLEHWEP